MSEKKEEKKKVNIKPWLIRRKSVGFYETLLAGLRLEDEYNYKNYLRMTSGNFDKEFQLIKDDITKEITKMREPVIFRL